VDASTFPAKATLRRVIERARDDAGRRLDDLTVLQNDPYRIDTPAGHRDAQWVTEHLDALYGTYRRAHLRGLHYAIVAAGNVQKPDGAIYRNTHDDWKWLGNTAGKAARWLGYIPFERIIDQRNAPPVIHRTSKVETRANILYGIDIDLPSVRDIQPEAYAVGFVPRQAYHFVIFGEKSSLEDIARPIAAQYEADLYLPSGEISDTLIHSMAKDAEDGRPMVLFSLSDCDPAGRQMPVSIARKLQAFRDLFYQHLKFEVVTVALKPEQVRELDLPETPLKEGEKRASRWREAFGIDQTEIDALTTPARAPILRDMLREAFEPYIDSTLRQRVHDAQSEWEVGAGEVIDCHIDHDHIESLRQGLVEEFARLRRMIDDTNGALSAMTTEVVLPAIEVPEPDTDLGADRPALVWFDDDWTVATRKLIRQKSYGGAA